MPSRLSGRAGRLPQRRRRPLIRSGGPTRCPSDPADCQAGLFGGEGRLAGQHRLPDAVRRGPAACRSRSSIRPATVARLGARLAVRRVNSPGRIAASHAADLVWRAARLFCTFWRATGPTASACRLATPSVIRRPTASVRCADSGDVASGPPSAPPPLAGRAARSGDRADESSGDDAARLAGLARATESPRKLTWRDRRACRPVSCAPHLSCFPRRTTRRGISHRCGASRAALHVVWSDDNVPRSRASVVQRKSRACSQTGRVSRLPGSLRRCGLRVRRSDSCVGRQHGRLRHIGQEVVRPNGSALHPSVNIVP